VRADGRIWALGVVDVRQDVGQHGENKQRTSTTMDQDSFRDVLAFSICFVIESNRSLLRRILKEHVSHDARQTLAKKVLEHLELSDSRLTKNSGS
jgi:hypothetical protein